MKKMNLLSAGILAALATTSLTAVAESVDIRVIGTITPAACTPTLGGGGTIDYGSINPAALSATDYTVLGVRTVPIAIQCDAPAKVAIKSINGRPNTLAGSTEGMSGFGQSPIKLFNDTSNPASAGLGLDGTTKIGGYAVRILESANLIDNTPAINILKGNAAGTWALGGPALVLSNPTDVRHISWSTTGDTTPVAFTTFSGTLEIDAYINKASELDLTKPVALDGMTTLELVYL